MGRAGRRRGRGAAGAAGPVRDRAPVATGRSDRSGGHARHLGPVGAAGSRPLERRARRAGMEPDGCRRLSGRARPGNLGLSGLIGIYQRLAGAVSGPGHRRGNHGGHCLSCLLAALFPGTRTEPCLAGRIHDPPSPAPHQASARFFHQDTLAQNPRRAFRISRGRGLRPGRASR